MAAKYPSAHTSLSGKSPQDSPRVGQRSPRFPHPSAGPSVEADWGNWNWGDDVEGGEEVTLVEDRELDEVFFLPNQFKLDEAPPKKKTRRTEAATEPTLEVGVAGSERSLPSVPGERSLPSVPGAQTSGTLSSLPDMPQQNPYLALQGGGKPLRPPGTPSQTSRSGYSSASSVGSGVSAGSHASLSSVTSVLSPVSPSSARGAARLRPGSKGPGSKGPGSLSAW